MNRFSRPGLLLRLAALFSVLLVSGGCLFQDDGGIVPTAVPVSPLTPTPSAAPLPPATGRIAFRSERSGAPELWVISPDGSKLEQITNGLNVGATHTWSPDGTRIAYQGQVGENRTSQILVTDLGPDNKPGQTIVLTGDMMDADNVWPSWSPDGTQIVFQSKQGDGNYQLYIKSPSGGGAVPITGTAAYAGNASWSPQGGLIAFVSGPDPQHTELYTVSARGGEPTRLTNLEGTLSRPVWSPDGGSLMFMHLVDNLNRITTIRVDGSGSRPLTTGQQEARIPVWSPDGKLIAFHSTFMPLTPGPASVVVGQSQNEVYVMDVDGGNLANVSGSQAGDTNPTWGPDSLRLAFSSNRDGSYRLYTVGIDGNNLAPLTTGSGDYDDNFPVWSR